MMTELIGDLVVNYEYYSLFGVVFSLLALALAIFVLPKNSRDARKMSALGLGMFLFFATGWIIGPLFYIGSIFVLSCIATFLLLARGMIIAFFIQPNEDAPKKSIE